MVVWPSVLTHSYSAARLIFVVAPSSPTGARSYAVSKEHIVEVRECRTFTLPNFRGDFGTGSVRLEGHANVKADRKRDTSEREGHEVAEVEVCKMITQGHDWRPLWQAPIIARSRGPTGCDDPTQRRFS